MMASPGGQRQCYWAIRPLHTPQQQEQGFRYEPWRWPSYRTSDNLSFFLTLAYSPIIKTLKPAPELLWPCKKCKSFASEFSWKGNLGWQSMRHSDWGAESSTAQPDITWTVVYGGLHVRWLRVIFPTGTQQVYGKASSTSQTQGPDGILERAFRDLAHKPSTHIPWPVGAICENAFHWLLICIQVGYQTAWSQYVCGLKVSFPYAHRL